ncbi:forkhead box protein N1-like [Stegostoma tigrinum]|uniref:forkhead box protein N1-like n=1 Tax=Stegostoma tigrinum TaxID=3053191 RepID=UPI002870A146|nr:forkhead box protein N1-like [Stegostoma tigrinum]
MGKCNVSRIRDWTEIFRSPLDTVVKHLHLQHNVIQSTLQATIFTFLQIQNPKYEANNLLGRRIEQTRHELLCHQSQTQHIYCSIPPLQHQYSGITSYPRTGPPTDQYLYQRNTARVTQESHNLLYPKPIYSYSILIFMALKNSKAGSLPVSEIYNFMTEHFPYFKTAPDGWKNSVRHNLSLNKCFEKVENKSGGTSRKGCLWTLNPNKIQKMQEELQKWRRKDPGAVRKCMAKPDELEKLIGEKPDQTKSTIMTSVSLYPQTPLSPLHAQDHSHSVQLGHFQHPHVIPNPQLQPYSEAAVQANMNQNCSNHAATQLQLDQLQLYSQPSAHSNTAQESPMAGQTALIPSITEISSQLLTEKSLIKDMHDIFLEGDINTDIDALNPSLVDFELQGNLWEVLKDENLTPYQAVSVPPQWPSLFPLAWNTSPTGNKAVTSPGSSTEQNLTESQLTDIYTNHISVDTKPSSNPIALV